MMMKHKGFGGQGGPGGPRAGRILIVAVLAGLVLGGCAAPAAGFGTGAVAGPTSDSSVGEASDCPAAVEVKRVPPVRGVGYSWVRASYRGGDQGVAPTWEISEGADIRAYSEDEFHAYVMAPTGTYKVRATGPCGVFGEVTVDHVITEP